ncbi:hypothetical protein ACFSQ7_28255 [Paenibacillus rhizoplanae]
MLIIGLGLMISIRLVYGLSILSGRMPLTSIPFPFLSYGQHVLIEFAAVGLLMGGIPAEGYAPCGKSSVWTIDGLCGYTYTGRVKIWDTSRGGDRQVKKLHMAGRRLALISCALILGGTVLLVPKAGAKFTAVPQIQNTSAAPAQSPVVKKNSLPGGFVYLDEVIPSAQYEIRYYSENNFYRHQSGRV